MGRERRQRWPEPHTLSWVHTLRKVEGREEGREGGREEGKFHKQSAKPLGKT